jgi:hypothetical protein
MEKNLKTNIVAWDVTGATRFSEKQSVWKVPVSIFQLCGVSRWICREGPAISEDKRLAISFRDLAQHNKLVVRFIQTPIERIVI